MATYKADTRYSYKKGKGGSSGSSVHTEFTVYGQSESAVMEKIKSKHGEQAEITIISIIWK
jgi:hypothetical protein